MPPSVNRIGPSFVVELAPWLRSPSLGEYNGFGLRWPGKEKADMSLGGGLVRGTTGVVLWHGLLFRPSSCLASLGRHWPLLPPRWPGLLIVPWTASAHWNMPAVPIGVLPLPSVPDAPAALLQRVKLGRLHWTPIGWCLPPQPSAQAVKFIVAPQGRGRLCLRSTLGPRMNLPDCSNPPAPTATLALRRKGWLAFMRPRR